MQQIREAVLTCLNQVEDDQPRHIILLAPEIGDLKGIGTVGDCDRPVLFRRGRR